MLFILKVLPLCLTVLLSFSVKAGDNAPHRADKNKSGIILTDYFIKSTDIVSFNAISDGRKVFVNWASGNEKNYDYFTIEKAKDGVHFETISTVKSAGKETEFVDYIDIDYTPYAGISYYRLKQTDYAGEVSYSDVVSVNYQFTKDGTIISCRDFDPIEFKELAAKEILVVVRDEKGIENVSKVILNTSNGDIYAVDVRKKLNPGRYTVIASSYNRLFSQNLIVQ